MPMNEAFETLSDTSMWEDAAAVLAGFLAPSVARRMIEGRINQDLPDEVYGLAVVAGATYLPQYQTMVQLGGAVYVADRVASRFGVQQQIRTMGGS